VNDRFKIEDFFKNIKPSDFSSPKDLAHLVGEANNAFTPSVTDCLEGVDFSVEKIDEFIYLGSHWSNKALLDVLSKNAGDLIQVLGEIIESSATGRIADAVSLTTFTLG
jgi:hypothetical protein